MRKRQNRSTASAVRAAIVPGVAALSLLLSACGGPAASATASTTASSAAPAVTTSSTAPASTTATSSAATTATSAATTASSAATAQTITAAPAAVAANCPNGGTVRYGVEPFEDSAKMMAIFTPFSQALAKNLGCKVELTITTNYNAEIEAMRAGKLDAGEFGPLGYVLAHQVAKADAVATYADSAGKPSVYYASIVTWPGSGATTLQDCAGKSFAYSDPASTSGHLFPAYGLRKAGIDPDTGVKGVFAGSHTSSFEALRNHKVVCGELNSDQMATAKSAGIYKDGDFVTLWKSDPIPQDPIAVRSDLPDAFKQQFVKGLLAVDLSQLPPDAQKSLQSDLSNGGSHLVAQNDAAFNQIRDLVSTLNVDLTKL